MHRVEGFYFALGSRLESVLLTYNVPIRIVFVFSRFRPLRLLFVIRLATSTHSSLVHYTIQE